MKKGIHPPYGPVVFRDRSTGRVFLTASTMTGTAQVMDTEGRVEAFHRRYGGGA